MRDFIQRLIDLTGSRPAQRPGGRTRGPEARPKRLQECRACHYKVGRRVSRCPRCGTRYTHDLATPRPS